MSTPLENWSAAKTVYACYLALLVWAPMPLGSNRPWAWSSLELAILILMLTWLALYVRGMAQVTATFKLALPAHLLLGAWLLYVWIQLLPLPISVLHALSPESARWHAAACGSALPCNAPLTVDSEATYEGALKSTAYAAFFVLSLLLLDSRERIYSCGLTLVFSGFIQALYGSLRALSSGGDAEGSFANRNHFASYLVMCTCIGIGIQISGIKDGNTTTFKGSIREAVRWVLSPRMPQRATLAIMVIALVLTHSRMGNSSFFLSLLVIGTVAIVLSRRRTASLVLLISSLFLIDIVILGSYFGVERVVDRIEHTDLEAETRLPVASSTLSIWEQYPVFGTGLGSFRLVYPRYRSENVAAPLTHAHNDYLEFASETGLIGVLLLGAFAVSCLCAVVRALLVRRDPAMRGLSVGALMATSAMAIHSTADFNLQIPANAITFLLILALCWISLGHGRRAAL